MKTYRQFVEALDSKTAVFAFGRFNPPTTGHGLLVEKVKEVAKDNGADHFIYASRTQDKKKNPLSLDRKLHFLKLMFPKTNFRGASDKERTFTEVAKALNGKYGNLIMVAGSDRVSDFEKLLKKYNGKDYNYSSIRVVSAGQRDPDADNVSGMSASKMRKHAEGGSFDDFKKGLPSHMRDLDVRRLMNDVRVGMGLDPIKEQLELNVSKLREAYFRNLIFRQGDKVLSENKEMTIIKRGSNHLILMDGDQTHVKWLHEVSPL